MQVGTQRGLATVRYVIDKSVSRFTVQTFSTGLLSAFGHNPTIGIRDYEGEVDFVPGTYDKAFLRVTIKSSSMEVLDEMKKDDREKLQELMFGTVLDVEHFPESTFESKQISVRKPGNGLVQASVSGDLALRGVTRSLTFDSRVMEMGAMLRISGDFTVRQSDYGIKPISFAGGALRLKDELKFSFEMVARQSEQTV